MLSTDVIPEAVSIIAAVYKKNDNDEHDPPDKIGINAIFHRASALKTVPKVPTDVEYSA